MTISEIRRGTAAANGIEIAYEEIGNADAPPVLMIMGFSAQLTLWPEGFVGGLADRGYRVIRFDNRDIGLSTKFDGVRVSGSPAVRLARGQFGRPARSRTPCTTWPPTPRACSTTWASSRRTSSARRWAG